VQYILPKGAEVWPVQLLQGQDKKGDPIVLQEEFCPDELQSFSHIRVNIANTNTSTKIDRVIQKLELGKMVVYLSKTLAVT